MNTAITFILNGVMTALFVYFAWDVYAKAKAATGTWYARLWAAARDSGTVMWLRFVSMVSAAIDSLVWISDAVNAPQVASAIQTYGGENVAFWAKVIVTITIVGEIARRRKGSKDPVSG